MALNAAGTGFVHTPAENFNATASFAYNAKDAAGALSANAATVSMTVRPVDDAPVATAQSAATNEDAAWSNLPKGGCTAEFSAACAAVGGKTTFGFVSKYVPGKNTPEGNTQFQFHAGNLNFKSTSYDALIVQGSRAQYWGYGTINNDGKQYTFRLTAYDDASGDRLRMEIWLAGRWETGQIVAANNLVYHNRTAAAETTTIQQGSIQVKQR